VELAVRWPLAGGKCCQSDVLDVRCLVPARSVRSIEASPAGLVDGESAAVAAADDGGSAANASEIAMSSCVRLNVHDRLEAVDGSLVEVLVDGSASSELAECIEGEEAEVEDRSVSEVEVGAVEEEEDLVVCDYCYCCCC
jgi:hypothetical protein